jgi:MFS family permease
MAALVLPLSALAPRLADRVGARTVVGAGFACMVVGFVLMSRLGVASHYPDFLLALLIFSGGLGLSATPATNAIVSALPAEKQGVASAVNDVTRELGSAIGIALLGSLFTGNYHSHLAGLPSALPPIAVAAIRQSPAAGVAVATDPRLGAARPIVERTVHLAFLNGMEHAFVAGAVASVVGLVYAVTRMPAHRPTPLRTGDYGEGAEPAEADGRRERSMADRRGTNSAAR